MSWLFDPSADTMQVIEILLWGKSKKWLINALMSYKNYHEPHISKFSPPFRKSLESRFCSKEALIYAILDAIQDTRTCSNGGFDVYIDSQGWYSVTLSDYDKLSPEKYHKLVKLAGYDFYSVPEQRYTSRNSLNSYIRNI